MWSFHQVDRTTSGYCFFRAREVSLHAHDNVAETDVIEEGWCHRHLTDHGGGEVNKTKVFVVRNYHHHLGHLAATHHLEASAYRDVDIAILCLEEKHFGELADFTFFGERGHGDLLRCRSASLMTRADAR